MYGIMVLRIGGRNEYNVNAYILFIPPSLYISSVTQKGVFVNPYFGLFLLLFYYRLAKIE